jgi:Tfp pilus assembly protein PilX
MERKIPNPQRGLTIVDVLVVLAVVAFLVFVATREFVLYAPAT